jgi:tRNA threonylcarbamoyladenosine biosynthesis protein TsaE
MNQTIISNSTSDTQLYAEKILSELKDFRVIALTGELGSGKTTFSQGLGQILGIKRMVSPTYVLLKQYSIKSIYPVSTLYHADLYRLSDSSEALSLGLSEIWSDPNSLLLIEWPEIVSDLLPKNTIRIHIKKLDNDKRQITTIF